MDLEKLIGNTPIIKIKYIFNGREREIYAKLESYNFTGSIKDRIVYYILKSEKDSKTIVEGQPLIEVSSGNTGISLSAIGAYYKHPVYIFLPDWVSLERRKILDMYNANVIFFSKEDGGFKKALEKMEELSKEINGYKLNQFRNVKNIEAHYNTTGKEILNKLPKINCFISGIGSGGTLMGVKKRIKETNNKIEVIAVEPMQLPLLSKNISVGCHKIEGIGDDFVPDIVNRNEINGIITINDEDAINMSKKISRDLGIGVGISSGANFLGAVLTNENNKMVVTIFPDDNKKYISTLLGEKEINNNNEFISNKIQLLDFKVI